MKIGTIPILLSLVTSFDPAPDRLLPDVVFVLLDEVSAADLDAVPTPNIDALAAGGLSFSGAYATPLCTTTRHALLFGEILREPHVFMECSNQPGAQPLDQPSLAEALSAAGYETAIIGKWHLTNHIDYRVGPHFHGFGTWRAGVMGNVNHCGGTGYRNWLRHDDGVSAFTRQYTLEAIRDAALAWLTAPRTERPRFTYICFQSAHFPHTVPPGNLLPSDYVVPANPTNREKFEAMIASVDFVMADIVAAAPGALIFVVGDNGTPPLLVPGMLGQFSPHAKGTCGERGTKVPFIVNGPWIGQGRSDALVHVTDTFATLADLLGLQGLSTGRDGISFLPALMDARSPGVRRYVYNLVFPVSWLPNPIREDSVRNERWKLRVYETGTARETQELYDLAFDPDERSPLPAVGPEADALRAILAEVRAP